MIKYISLSSVIARKLNFQILLLKNIHIDEGNSSYLFLCVSRDYTLEHFLAGARDTPDRLPGGFCHQAAEAEERRAKKLIFILVIKTLKNPLEKGKKTASEGTFCEYKLIL